MSDNDSPTRFTLDLPGFQLDISGDRAFVEELYHRVSLDILPLIFPNHPAPRSPARAQAARRAKGYTWVYGVTQYYSKVYAVSDDELRAGLLGPYLDPGQVRRIYVARDDHDLFTSLAGGQKTLWAEFTAEGRSRFQG
jgi:hypothetical protein